MDMGRVLFILALCIISLGDLSNSCVTVYTRLGNSPNPDVSPSGVACGLNPQQPCPTILAAIRNGASQVQSTCIEVLLLESNYRGEIPCESLDSVGNVTVRGDHAGIIPMALTTCRNSTWLGIYQSENVIVQNLEVTMEGGWNNTCLHVETSYNISIVDSVFGQPELFSQCVHILNSMEVNITSCLFYGEQQPSPFSHHELISGLPQFKVAAVEARQDCLLGDACARNASNTPELCCNCSEQFQHIHPMYFVSFSNCTFRDYGISPIYSLYTSSSRYESGVGIMVGAMVSLGLKVYIRNCTFSNLSSPFDTALKLYSYVNTVETYFVVEDCVFRNCWSYLGGAIYVYTSSGTDKSAIQIQRCQFSNNTAFLQGGAIAWGISGDSSLAVTAYSPRSAYKLHIEDCSFVDNRVFNVAVVGAGGTFSLIATSVFEGTEARVTLPNVVIRNCLVDGSRAHYGGALFASHVALELTNTTVTGCVGESTFSLSSSRLVTGRNVNFTNNTSTGNGGGISLFEHSYWRLQNDSTVYFVNNSADDRGGGVYVDISSSTVGLPDVLESFSAVGLVDRCFVTSEKLIKYQREYEQASDNDGPQVLFDGNRAFWGDSIFANGFGSCMHPLKDEFLLSSDQQSTKELVEGVSSGVVWLHLDFAGTSCLKQNPYNSSQVWMYDRFCNTSVIHSDILHSDIYAAQNMTEIYAYAVQKLNFTMRKYQTIGGFFTLPSPEIFVTPWAYTIFQWFYPRLFGVPTEELRMSEDNLRTTYLGSVTLYPSPGEIFPLRIQLRDVFFKKFSGLAQVQVGSGPALLIADQEILKRRDSLMFCAATVVYIGLAGQPGATGTLKVTAQGQLTTASIELTIPYRLRGCPIGYKETDQMRHNTSAEVWEYINNFENMPLDRTPGVHASQLVCRCPTLPGVISCQHGYQVTVEWSYWAGLDNADKLYTSEKTSYITDLAEYERADKARQLLTAPCCCGLCTDHDYQDWSLRDTAPCVSTRQGAICGQCAPGYGYHLGWHPTCGKCGSEEKQSGRLSIAFNFVLTGMLLFLVSYFQVGQSAVYDAFASYEQMVIFLTRRDTEVHTLTTVEIGGCLSESTSIMEIISTIYVKFLSFLFWLLLVYYFSRLVFVRRFVLNHSLIVGLWALLTFFYSFLLYPSFILLACHKFNGKWVLYLNGDITCFGAAHAPWGAFAIVALVLIAIPLPVVLLMGRSHPRIKPLIDVYLSFVKDDKTWYIAYSLGRRFVLALVSVYTTNATVRQIALAALMQLFLLLHVLIQPYRRSRDNLWETVFLTCAGVYAALNIPDSAVIRVQMMTAVYAVPVGAVFLYGLVTSRKQVLVLVEYLLTALLFPIVYLYCKAHGKELERIRLQKPPKVKMDENGEPLIKTTKEHVQRAKDVYELRDEFMVDVFLQDTSTNL